MEKKKGTMEFFYMIYHLNVHTVPTSSYNKEKTGNLFYGS